MNNAVQKKEKNVHTRTCIISSFNYLVYQTRSCRLRTCTASFWIMLSKIKLNSSIFAHIVSLKSTSNLSAPQNEICPRTHKAKLFTLKRVWICSWATRIAPANKQLCIQKCHNLVSNVNMVAKCYREIRISSRCITEGTFAPAKSEHHQGGLRTRPDSIQRDSK